MMPGKSTVAGLLTVAETTELAHLDAPPTRVREEIRENIKDRYWEWFDEMERVTGPGRRVTDADEPDGEWQCNHCETVYDDDYEAYCCCHRTNPTFSKVER